MRGGKEKQEGGREAEAPLPPDLAMLNLEPDHSCQLGASALSTTYAFNTGKPQYIGQMLTSMKGEINSNTIIV